MKTTKNRPMQMQAKVHSRYCHFCVNSMDDVDYKNWQLLQRFTSSYGKIVPKRRSGVCSKHQKRLAQAIKRSRFMALLAYANR